MFQDYCAAHGRPCISGSIYCCEQCRIEDLNTNYEPKQPEPVLLYECPLCQSNQCVHYNNLKTVYILDTLKNYDLENYIKSNYCKWLVKAKSL